MSQAVEAMEPLEECSKPQVKITLACNKMRELASRLKCAVALGLRLPWATPFTGSVCSWAPRTCTHFLGGQLLTTRSSNGVVHNGVKQEERKARTLP